MFARFGVACIAVLFLPAVIAAEEPRTADRQMTTDEHIAKADGGLERAIRPGARTRGQQPALNATRRYSKANSSTQWRVPRHSFQKP